MEKKRIGEILRDSHIISEIELQRALEAQKATGERLGGTLLRLKMVDSSILVKALGEHYAVEGVDLAEVVPTKEALELLSAEDCLRLSCLPLWRDGDSLAVAAADPRDGALFEELAKLTGHQPRAYVAPQSAIYRSIRRSYRTTEPGPPRIQQLRAVVQQLRGAVERLEELLEE